MPTKPSSLTKYRVPRTLEALTMACLEKSPERRPDIAAFIRTLQEDWVNELTRAPRR